MVATPIVEAIPLVLSQLRPFVASPVLQRRSCSSPSVHLKPATRPFQFLFLPLVCRGLFCPSRPVQHWTPWLCFSPSSSHFPSLFGRVSPYINHHCSAVQHSRACHCLFSSLLLLLLLRHSIPSFRESASSTHPPCLLLQDVVHNVDTPVVLQRRSTTHIIPNASPGFTWARCELRSWQRPWWP